MRYTLEEAISEQLITRQHLPLREGLVWFERVPAFIYPTLFSAANEINLGIVDVASGVWFHSIYDHTISKKDRFIWEDWDPWPWMREELRRVPSPNTTKTLTEQVARVRSDCMDKIAGLGNDIMKLRREVEGLVIGARSTAVPVVNPADWWDGKLIRDLPTPHLVNILGQIVRSNSKKGKLYPLHYDAIVAELYCRSKAINGGTRQ